MRDYYEILGLDKNASADDIKKAYRRLAHKYHPDKAGGDHQEAEAKFKEINEAYQVLSDPQKKAAYDRFGHAGVGQGSPFGGGAGAGGFNPFGGGFEFDFGGRGGGFGFGGFETLIEDLMGSAFANVNAEVTIPLTQAVLGGEVTLRTSTNETIDLRVPPGTQDGQTFVFRGKGNQHRRGRGDLHVTVRIQTPRRLTREQRELFEKLRETGL